MTGRRPVAVISGCSRGIGLATAELFAAEGFDVAGASRNAEQLERLQQSFSEKYPQQDFFFAAADLSVTEAVKRFAAAVTKRFPSIDVLVNNAGTFLPGKITEESDGVLEQLIATNVYSAYHLSRGILPALMRSGRASIFNMCSVASLQAYPNGGSYAISKFALLGLSRQLRLELKDSNIRVTALIPGATLTDSWQGTDLPAARFIQPSDVAKTILGIYRLSDGANVEEVVLRPLAGDI